MGKTWTCGVVHDKTFIDDSLENMFHRWSNTIRPDSRALIDEAISETRDIVTNAAR